MPDSILAVARRRWQECQNISDYARSKGLDTTPAKVNRNFVWWVRWHQGGLSTGYLMNRTGTKFITTGRST